MNEWAANSNWPLVGHAEASAAVRAAIVQDRIPHAWLITGPEGVGRTTLALLIAQALNCERQREQRPCGTCDSCKRIAARNHPDVLVADMAWQHTMVGSGSGERAKVRQRFSIDAIRWLRGDIVMRPIQGRWKVQILDDAGLFSHDAPDAFLKVLEEPPPYAVLILVAESVDQAPETIRSRCRHIALGLVSAAEIVSALRHRGVDAEQATQLAQIARGRVGWVFDALHQPDLLLQRRVALETAFEHLTTPLGRAAITGVIAGSHAKKRDDTYTLLAHWVGMWRDALLLQVGLGDALHYPELGARLADWSARFDVPTIVDALAATQRCLHDLDTNVQARIALQAMVTRWPS
ncbi:MAG: DNA polymerase III subunit delta' [Chloroflexi bacterium]|nr:MAG: DNA polymerase III subunit delta' [Chloroflexota bacterium]